jgi:hypothetical protein
MILLIPLVMALVAIVQSQKSLNWIQEMPKDYSLNQGDIVKLVLDDFLDVKGARFNTGEAANFPTPDIIPKIFPLTKNVAMIDGNAKNCYQSYTDYSGWVYMICNTRYLVAVKVDASLGNVTASSSIELATPQTQPAGNNIPILKPDTQICGEIIEDNGVFLIPCFIQTAESAPAGTPNDVFVFRVPKPTNGSFNGVAITYTVCKNPRPVSGYLKMVKHASTWIFYNGYPLGTPTANVIPFMTCNLAQETQGYSTSNSYNLVELLLEGSFTGHIRFFRTLSNDQVLFAIANNEPTNKTIAWGAFQINAAGVVTTTKLAQNLTIWNSSMLPEFNPKNTLIYVPPAESTQMYLIGDNYLHMASFSPSTSGAPFISFGNWTSFWLNCGHKSTYFVSKITQTTGLFSDPNSRIMIEYRALDGASYKMQDFTIHFNTTRYGCASSTPLEPSQIQVATLLNHNTVFTTNDLASFFRLAPDTILNIMVSGNIPTLQSKITASLFGYTSNSSTMNINMAADATKVNSFAWNYDSFRAYSDQSFALPIGSNGFIMNAPTLSTVASNIEIKHSNTSITPLTTALPTNAIVHRVFSIDADTYGAVLRFTTNGTEGFYIFWTTLNNDTIAIRNTSAIVQLEKGQIFFKAFKLGVDAYCIVLKRSFAVGTNSSTVSCWEDKPNGAQLLTNQAVSDTQEIHDMQILESLSRVDILMVGVATQALQNSLFYFSLDISPSKEIKANKIIKINLDDSSYGSSYTPVDASFDLWGDQDGSSFISVKMVKQGNSPVLAKYALTFKGDEPKVNLVYAMQLDAPDIAFCANKNEMILYNPRKREIFSMRWDVGMGFTDKNKLFFPLKEYGIQFIQQFNCISDKGYFQILGSNSNKEKFVITYRGGESLNLGRRVHSVSKVDPTVNFIESGTGPEFFVTVAGATGPNTAFRAFIINWYNGPLIWVKNAGKPVDYSFTIKSTPYSVGGNAPVAEQLVKISIATPVYTPTPRSKEKFNYNTGDTVMLDDKADIQGPVMDIAFTGEIANLEITKRNNKHKSYNPFNAVTADRVFVESSYMALLYQGTKVTFIGDPSLTGRGVVSTAPVQINSLSVNARDLALIRLGTSNEAIAVIKTYISLNSSYCYSLFHLSKSGTGESTAYLGVVSENLYCQRNDFDSLQITGVKNSGDVVIGIRSRKAYISNFIRLVSFSQVTGNKYVFKATAAILSEAAKNIAEYSIVDTGKNSVAIISYYEGYSGIIIGIWDTLNSGPTFKSSAARFRLNSTDTQGAILSLNYLKCWFNETLIADCILTNSGISNYMFQITYVEDKLKDPITNTLFTGEFEIPPMFEIKRIDKGKEHVGFLLQKTVANKVSRILQSSKIDKFSDCNNIIAIYKPSKGKNIYTGITCSEWNKVANVDFAMEFDAKEYLYYTRSPTVPTSRILQGGAADTNTIGVNFVGPIILKFNGPVDGTKVHMSFIGLMGSAEPNPPKMTLEEFKQGAETPKSETSGGSFWTWFIIIVIILVVIGGGYAGWMWYQGQSSASTGTYTKTTTSGGDLEDSRL